MSQEKDLDFLQHNVAVGGLSVFKFVKQRCVIK